MERSKIDYKNIQWIERVRKRGQATFSCRDLIYFYGLDLSEGA